MTISPDVSVSTNLGGWINKAGVFGPAEEPFYEGRSRTALSWRVSPSGRHVELGISEMNLFLPLGQLGLSRDFQASSSSRSGRSTTRSSSADWRRSSTASTRARGSSCSGRRPASRFHARAARTSRLTPGIGMELPGVLYAEPTYAREVEWILLDQLRGCRSPRASRSICASRRSLSTRRRSPRSASGAARRPASRRARGRLLAARGRAGRRLRGARHLRGDRARSSARRRTARGGRGRRRDVLCISSPDQLYRGWRRSRLTHLDDDRDASDPTSSICCRRRARPPHRHGDRRRFSLAGVHRRLSRRPLVAARRRPLRPVRQPARGLRGLPDLAGGDRHGGAHRARAIGLISRVPPRARQPSIAGKQTALASPDQGHRRWRNRRSIWNTIGGDIGRYRNYPRIVGETPGLHCWTVPHPPAPARAARGERRADARDHDGTVDDGCRERVEPEAARQLAPAGHKLELYLSTTDRMTTIGKGVFLIGPKARRNAVDETQADFATLRAHASTLGRRWVRRSPRTLAYFQHPAETTAPTGFSPWSTSSTIRTAATRRSLLQSRSTIIVMGGRLPVSSPTPWRCTLKERSATLSRRATLPCEQVPELLRE